MEPGKHELLLIKYRQLLKERPKDIDWEGTLRQLLDEVWPVFLKLDLAPQPLNRKQVEMALDVASKFKDALAIDHPTLASMAESPEGVYMDANTQEIFCKKCGWRESFLNYPLSISAWVFLMGAVARGHDCRKEAHGGQSGA